VRCYAAEALGKFGAEAKEAIPYLIKAFNDGKREGSYLVVQASLAVVKIGPEAKSAKPELIEVMIEGLLESLDIDDKLTVKAAKSLTMLENKALAAIPKLIDSLKDQSSEYRRNAIIAL
jgi:HEAT repeat protein